MLEIQNHWSFVGDYLSKTNILYFVQSIFMFFPTVTSCMSFRLSARMNAPATGHFAWNLILDTSLKSFQKIKISFIGQNNGKFTWRSKCAFTLTCFEHPNVHPQDVTVARAMNSLRKTLLRVTQYLDTADSDISYYKSPQHTEGHCCLSVATTVTRKRHNVKIFVHCLPCCAICSLEDRGGEQSMDNRNCMFSCSTDYWAVEASLGDMASNPSRSESGKKVETFLIARIEEGWLNRQKSRQAYRHEATLLKIKIFQY